MMRFYILAAALLFSTGGLAIKSSDFGSWQVASFRCGLAALTLLALMPPTRRWPDRRTLIVGAVYATTLVLYVLANKTTTAANAIFLQSTAPIYVLLLAPLLLGEKTRRRDLLLMAVIAAGLMLVLFAAEPPQLTAPDPVRGNLLGALAGFFWALTIVGLRWIARQEEGSGNNAASAVVVGNVLGFFACLPAALPVTGSQPQDWLLIGYLGVFQIGVAYMLLTSAIRQVPAFDAALLLLVEPIFSPVWVWLLHGEIPSRGAMVGGLLIVVGTAVKSWVDFRTRPDPERNSENQLDARN